MSFLSFSINFAVARKFYCQFAFGVREVQVRDRFGDGEKAVYVIRAGKKLLCHVPRGRAAFRDEAYDIRLSLVYRAQVTVKKFFVIRHVLAVPAVYERRRKRAQACEAHQIFRERAKAFGWINRVGREDWIRRDAL